LSDEWKLHEGGYSESKAFAYRKDLKVVSAVDDQNDVIDPKSLIHRGDAHNRAPAPEALVWSASKTGGTNATLN